MFAVDNQWLNTFQHIFTTKTFRKASNTMLSLLFLSYKHTLFFTFVKIWKSTFYLLFKFLKIVNKSVDNLGTCPHPSTPPQYLRPWMFTTRFFMCRGCQLPTAQTHRKLVWIKNSQLSTLLSTGCGQHRKTLTVNINLTLLGC